MNFPEELKYTKEHEWIKVDGEIATIGITDFAQHELGDVVFVELPAVGAELKKGQPFGVVESVKAVSDVYAPIGGTVSEVNERLNSQPELVNEDPYGGWFIRLKIEKPEELDDLMEAAAYREYTENTGD